MINPAAVDIDSVWPNVSAIVVHGTIRINARLIESGIEVEFHGHAIGHSRIAQSTPAATDRGRAKILNRKCESVRRRCRTVRYLEIEIGRESGIHRHCLACEG